MLRRIFHTIVSVMALLCLLEASFLYSRSSTVSLFSRSTTGTIEKKLESCMKMANLDSNSLLARAKSNSRYFLEEYRRVIPENSLEGYRSHCWKEDYSANWTSESVSGSIGTGVNFSLELKYYPYKNVILPRLMRPFKKQFKSDIICLPKVFLVGFSKCGSSYLYSFIEGLVSLSTTLSSKTQIWKETQFWAPFEAYEKPFEPKVEDLGKYILNFLPGIDIVAKQSDKNMLVVDATPNIMVEWPVFRLADVTTNYCLLPAVLPTLLPGSKFIAIMRNPIKMLYSNFWFSCTKHHLQTQFDETTAPDIFHKRVIEKIGTFNDCMRNESVPAISSPCSLESGYSTCIKQRLHLLDECGTGIIANTFSSDLPYRCGEITLFYGMFYIHVRKWLSIVRREDLLLLTLEELKAYPNKVAGGILQFLNLNALSYQDIDDFVKKVSKTAWKNSQHFVNYKTDPRLRMRADTELALERFYRPFNELLAQLLGSEKFLWF